MTSQRDWMTRRDPEATLAAVEYALAFFWKTEAGVTELPEPDLDLAEQALSLVAGLFTARFGDLHDQLLRARQRLLDHPGQWPEVPSN